MTVVKFMLISRWLLRVYNVHVDGGDDYDDERGGDDDDNDDDGDDGE